MSTTETKILTPLDPHLIFAYVFWLEENGFRPHVTFEQSGVSDPALRKFLSPQGLLTLNITSSAVKDLRIGEFISFSARFQGVATSVNLPISSLQQVWTPDAPGLVFIPPAMQQQEFVRHQPTSKPKDPPASTDAKVTSINANKKPTLTIIK